LSVMLADQAVTEMLFTPSLLDNLLNTVDAAVLQERFKSLKTIFVNGEVLSMTLRTRCLQKLPHVRFINLYSISECHEVGAVDLTDIDTTLSTKYCPIGIPCSVSPVYILSEETGLPVVSGTAGELYVGGDMLARGYLNLPELSATRFVPDPFAAGVVGAKMYRTGDTARMLENGQLEICGRCDFMVKIRGYSIVLGAVESALVEAVALTSCVVVADGEEGEEKHLVAYVVRAPHDDADARLSTWSIDTRAGSCPEMRRAVDGALPHYMIPSVFIEVENLPVSVVGAKLDRKALQAQTADRRTMLRSLQLVAETHTTATGAMAAAADQDHHDYSTAAVRWKQMAKYLKIPRGTNLQDVQDTMATLWEMVLDRESGSLGPDSDFHENGGHSLSAARLVALINKVFDGSRISAIQLFRDGTTVGKLSNEIVTMWSSNGDHDTVGSNGTGSSSDKDWSVIDADDYNKILQQVKDDSILPEDVVVKSGASESTMSLLKARCILLTGATGFLGVHALTEILSRNPTCDVVCLVRSGDKQDVQTNMERYGLSGDLSRVVVVKGDLSSPLLGLSQGEWDTIASTVDAIVHCGAAVSLTAPYSMLQPINVSGTLSVIRLACACKSGTPLVHVSSNGIFAIDKDPDEIFLENDDIKCLPGRLGASNGYGLSKWAAERLVTAAHARGLPTMTIRFGNIGWHSITGLGNSLDYQGMLLSGCRRLSSRPQTEGWKFEVTPVDFAASAMIALAGDAKLLADGAIFNCVQNGFTQADQIFEWMSTSDSKSIPAISLDAWKRRIEDSAATSEDADLTALLAFTSGLQEDDISIMAHLECSKFDAALVRVAPELMRQSSADMMEYYKTFWMNISLPVPLLVSGTSSTIGKALAVDPKALGEPVGPLAGKVAVVTGASSGIGQGIVLALVKAGCNVAMGARRLGELEKTQDLIAKSCTGSASKTVILSTDVSKREQVAALVELAETSLGPVDILVNCAGCMYFTLMKNVIWDQWDAQVDVNAKGTMYGIGTVLPKMLERGRGHIVNITSDAGRTAFPGLAIYSGSKYFIEGVSKALRAETASTGLKVTCIQPGNVATPLLAKSTDPDGVKEYGEPTGAKVLEPADIGRAVLYALTQPEWCAVNEILVEPREEPV
jgi:thioester reductase-like protein